jgi:hypothetical protein
VIELGVLISSCTLKISSSNILQTKLKQIVVFSKTKLNVNRCFMKETSRTNMLFLNETKLLTDVSEFVFEQENFPFDLTRAHEKHFSDQKDSGKGRCSETRCSENQSSENLSFLERY